jgi:hypothetical protein
MTAKRIAAVLGVFVLLVGTGIPAFGQQFKQEFQWIISQRLTVTHDGIDVQDGSVVIADFARMSAQETISVTMNGEIAPTGSYQPLSSAGTVNTADVDCGTAGNVVTLINTTNTSIVISDTGTLKLTGNITLGQYDSLTLWSDGTNCVQLATANN